MKNLTIRKKSYLGIFVLLAAITFSGILFFISVQKGNKNAELINALGRQRVLTQMMAKSILIYTSSQSHKAFLEQQIDSLDKFVTQTRKAYTELVVGPAQEKGMEITQDLDHGSAIPFPATLTRVITERLDEGQKFSMDIISDNPINPSKSLTTSLDKNAFSKIQDGGELFSKIYEQGGGYYMAIYTPDRASTKECVACHNAIQDQKTYELGDLLGIRRYQLVYSDDISIGQAELNYRLDDYKKSKDIFQSTLNAVRFGGPIFKDLEKQNQFHADPIQEPSFQSKADEIANVFKNFENSVDRLMNSGVESPSYRRARQAVLSQADILRIFNNNLVDLFTGIARDSNQNFQSWVMISIASSILVLMVMGFYLSRFILRPVDATSRTLEKLSQGKLTEELLPVRSEDEIGLLNRSCNRLMTGLKQFIGYTEAIIMGKTETENLDAHGEFHTALNRMAGQVKERQKAVADKEELEKTSQDLKQKNWLTSSLAELNVRIRQGNQDINLMAQKTIGFLAERLNAQVGALYLEEDGIFKLTGTYAFTNRKNLSNEYRVGEGLVGQAAFEKDIITVTNVPDDYITVTSGLGENIPSHIAVIPLIHEGKATGVVELATLERFSEVHLEFLRQSTEVLAISFNLAKTQTHLRDLLEESQAQAEELRNQQEELHQQQEELRQSNQYLEEQSQKLQEQRNNIENQHQMIQIKARELEKASQYKSEFLANMSHELRTPLNSVMILSQHLERNQDGNLTEKQMEFAKNIRSSGEDLLNLINDILDLSKVEAGKMDVDVQQIDVRQWAASIHQKFTPVADEKGVPMHILVEDNVTDHIFSDPKRLDQICKNLLSNAFKFTEQGKVTLEIKQPEEDTEFIRSDLDPASTLAISVSDTGKGISPEKQDSIFEAFQQEDGATNRKFGGTGLGLSICKEMVKLLGGEMHMESEPGKGSTFTFYVPVGFSKEGAETKPSSRAATEGKLPEAHTPLQEESMRVAVSNRESSPLLIVEDDEKFGEVLTNMAQSQGYNAIAVQTGEAGLKLAYSHRPSGILLDLGLPGMDGLEVISNLRANPYTWDIPIYVISGQGKMQQALQVGAVGYLEKPVDTDKLKEALKELDEAPSNITKTVLFVEDDSTMRKNILESLAQVDNVETLGAATIKEALQILHRQRVDCLIVDLSLGEESGETLLEHIKDHEFLKYIPVVVYTGQDLSPQQETVLKQYSQKIIIKGAESLDRLMREVRFHLFGLKKNLLVIGDEQETERSIERDLDLVGKKVLLVDDDMRNVFALTNILEEKGITVVTGKNGREGLKNLEAEPDIDLVLMDIMMPEMDGYEAIKRIRRDLQRSDLPIIALTAKAMKGDRKKCLEVGANEYLTKPIESKNLLEKINSFLKGD